jgi:hypothetical protein
MLVLVVKLTFIGECTTEERSCCSFLGAEGLNAKDIHKEMFSVYGGKCLSCKAAHIWVKKYGERSADDEEFETDMWM